MIDADRPGISRIALTVALVAVVAVAGVAFYVARAPSVPSSTTQASTSTGSSSGSGASLMVAMVPASPLIAPGQTQNYSSIEVTTLAPGLSGTLVLRALAPAGVSLALNESSVSLANDPQSIPVTLKADSSLSPGKYKVTIEESSSSFPALNQTVMIDVVPALVIMQNLAFHPQNITVPTGTTVSWINLDSNIGCCDPGNHDVSFLSGANATSPVMTRLETYSYTFGAAGVVEYYCSIHPFMKGQVTVTA